MTTRRWLILLAILASFGTGYGTRAQQQCGQITLPSPLEAECVNLPTDEDLLRYRLQVEGSLNELVQRGQITRQAALELAEEEKLITAGP